MLESGRVSGRITRCQFGQKTPKNTTNGWKFTGRPNGYSFAHGASTWSYDTAGRPASVTDGTDTFAYGYRYILNGVLHEGTTASGQSIESVMPFTLNGPQVRTTLAYETTRNALAFRQNDISAGTLSRFAYGINDIGQRDSLTPTGSAFANNTPFAWGYNGRGELTSATRSGSPSFARAYSYDGIGNRLTATDQNGATTGYFADTGGNTAGGNALNQYASISYPGSNTLEPVHDADGNLTGGPVPGVNGLSPGVPIPANATLTWDAENRLAKAVVNSATIHYVYDHQSRLIARTEGSVTVRYLYDGWNRIAEYNDNGAGHTLERVYVWGMDSSGSMQGAGGVGGLLSMTVHGTSAARFYPTYDGNGNVSEYMDGSGTKAAHFEYDPFGNLTVDSEGNATEFPYRFSTKPQDPVTGLCYYGYRFYDPVTGRWPSRDPIGEDGGNNLYGFISNSGINNIDVLGNLILTKEKEVYQRRVIEALTLVAGGKLFWKKDEKRKTTVGGIGSGDWYILCIDKESKGEFWDDVKLGIEDDIDRVLSSKTHTGEDAPDDNAAGGTNSTTPRRIQIGLNVQVNTPLIDEIRENGQLVGIGVHTSGVGPAWRKQLVGFDVNIWHELVGHSIKELKHPREKSNAYILKSANGKFEFNNAFKENPDETIEFENKVRTHLELPLRRPQYYDYYDLSKPAKFRYYSTHKDLPEDKR